FGYTDTVSALGRRGLGHREMAASASHPSGEWNDPMTRTELIVQLLKIAIGLAFGAYFVWWSLQVLDRLTPEYDASTAGVAREYEDRTATHRYEPTREAAIIR